MTKYHFEIVDGHTIEDPKGIELATERQARKVAAEIAKQMAGDSNDNSLTDVVVKNSAGEVVHKNSNQVRSRSLNELRQSSPSEVAVNLGSTRVALGFRTGLVSLDFGLTHGVEISDLPTVSSCFLIWG